MDTATLVADPVETTVSTSPTVEDLAPPVEPLPGWIYKPRIGAYDPDDIT